MLNGRLQMTMGLLVGAETEVGLGIFGTDGKRVAEFGGAFFRAALGGQIVAEDVVGYVVLLGQFDGAAPERFSVMPVGDLMIGQRTKSQQAGNRWSADPRSGEFVILTPAGGGVSG